MRKIRSFFREIKYAIQRAKRGYCDRDVWQIDTWFLTVMPKMLTQLSETAHAYPFSMQDLYFESHKEEYADALREYEETCGDSVSWEDFFHFRYHHSKAHVAQYSRLWRETLQRMANLFSEAAKAGHSPEIIARDYRRDCLKDGFRLFVKYFDDLWD